MTDLEAPLAKLAATKDRWASTTPAARAAVLRRILPRLVEVAPAWVRDGARAKGIAPGDPLEGEEWIAGPMAAIRNARLLAEALEQGAAPKPPRVRARDDGQLVADVFPASLLDRAVFAGIRAEVWIERGKPATQGTATRAGGSIPGRVALVLGAGNVSSIAPMDVFTKALVEGQVVVLKMNPVNTWLTPHLAHALAPLVEEGALAIVEGGADVGAALAEHPLVDTLHVTGSERTYDAIVWGGTDEERARNKAERTPRNTRPFSAELGCVTPVIVVPGPWSDADMRYHARQIAGMVANNASFNCNAAKVLITARGWLQRETFLAEVERALARTAPRRAYYPGAEDRHRAFLERYPAARVVGAHAEGAVPWTVIPDVPDREGEHALVTEAWCGVLAEVTLDARDPDELLAKAVPFVNDRVAGTLSACLLVHPTTAHDHAAALDRAITELRYGGIAINAWPALLYALSVTTWGAFPGATPESIGSGVGVVHNTYLFDHPEKSVLYAPFRIRPTPVWFTDHRALAEVGQRLVALEAAPTWGKVLRVARAALRA